MKKIVTMLMLLFVGMTLFTGCSSNESKNAENTEIKAEDLSENKNVIDEPTEEKIISDNFPDNLENCNPFSEKFEHPFSGEEMNREILGLEGELCHYKEEMPGGGMMDCKYTKEMRNAVAQYYRDVASAESVGTEVNSDLGSGETETKYTINGKEVSNPLQEAMTNGQCEISGY